MDPPLIEQDSWTTAQLRQSEKLTLATDVGLLKCMQNLSQKIVTQTSNLLKVLDDLQKDSIAAYVQVEHSIQQLNLISTKQYVENRVYDEEVSERQTSNMLVEQEKTTGIDFVPIIKDALAYGLSIQHLQMDANDNLHLKLVKKTIGEESLLLRKSYDTNSYTWRPLPHLIGSEEFVKSPTVGILYNSSREAIEQIHTQSIEPPPPFDLYSNSFNNNVSHTSFSSHSPIDEIPPVEHVSTEEPIPETPVSTDTHQQCNDKKTDLPQGFMDLQSELSSRFKLPEPQLSVSSEQLFAKPSVVKQHTTEQQSVADTKPLYSAVSHPTEQNKKMEPAPIPKVQTVQHPRQQNSVVIKPERKRGNLFDESSDSDDGLFKIPSQNSLSSSTVLKASSDDDLFNIGPRSSSAASDINKTSPDTSASITSTVSKVSSSAAFSSGGSSSFISSTTASNISVLSSSTRKDKLFFDSDSDDEDLFADVAKKPTLLAKTQTLHDDDLFATPKTLFTSPQVSAAPSISKTVDKNSSDKKSDLPQSVNANGDSITPKPKNQYPLFDDESYDGLNFIPDSKNSASDTGKRNDASSRVIAKPNIPVSSKPDVSKAASSGKTNNLRSLFDDDDDDNDIFSVVKTVNKAVTEKTEQKGTTSVTTSKSIDPHVPKISDSKLAGKVVVKSMSLFGDTDSDDDLFGDAVTKSKGSNHLLPSSSVTEAAAKDTSKYPVVKNESTHIVLPEEKNVAQDVYMDIVVDEIKSVGQPLICDTTKVVSNPNKESFQDKVTLPADKLLDGGQNCESSQVILEKSKNSNIQIDKDIVGEETAIETPIPKNEQISELPSNGSFRSHHISDSDDADVQRSKTNQNDEIPPVQPVAINTFVNVDNDVGSLSASDKNGILNDEKIVQVRKDDCEKYTNSTPVEATGGNSLRIKGNSTSLFGDSDTEEDNFFGNKFPSVSSAPVDTFVKLNSPSPTKQPTVDESSKKGDQGDEGRIILPRPIALPLPSVLEEKPSQQSPTKSLIASLKQTLSEQSNSPTSPTAGDSFATANRKPFGGVAIVGPGFPVLPISTTVKSPECDKEQFDSPSSPIAGDSSATENRKPFGGVAIVGPDFPVLPISSTVKSPEWDKEQSNSPTSPTGGNSAAIVNRKPFGGVAIMGPGFPALSISSTAKSPEWDKESNQNENKNENGTLTCPGKYRPRIQNQRRLPSRYHRRSKLLDSEDSVDQDFLRDGNESNINPFSDQLSSSASNILQQPIPPVSDNVSHSQSGETEDIQNVKQSQECEKSNLAFDDSDGSDDELFKKPIRKDSPEMVVPSTKTNSESAPGKIVTKATNTNKQKKHSSLFGEDSDSDDALFSGKMSLPSATKRVGIALQVESDEDDLFKTTPTSPSEKKIAPTTNEKPAFSDPLLGNNEW